MAMRSVILLPLLLLAGCYETVTMEQLKAVHQQEWNAGLRSSLLPTYYYVGDDAEYHYFHRLWPLHDDRRFRVLIDSSDPMAAFARTSDRRLWKVWPEQSPMTLNAETSPTERSPHAR